MRCAIVCGLVVAGGVASADDVPAFGSRGVVEIGASTNLDATYTSFRPAMRASFSSKRFGGAADLSYFVSDGLSVGGAISFGYSSYPTIGNYVGTDFTSIAIGPVVGYHLWLRPQLVSLWPRASVTYGRATDSYADGTPSVTDSGFALSAMVPLVIHPVPHFFFEVGPSFFTDLSSRETSAGLSTDRTKTTSFSLFVALGGWL